MEKTLYDLLGISPDASESEIGKAFRKAAKRYHPDSSGDDTTILDYERVVNAKETLLNPLKRKEYDRSIGLGYHASYNSNPRQHSTFDENFGNARNKSTVGNTRGEPWVPPVYPMTETIVPEWTLPESFTTGTKYKMFHHEPLKNVVVSLVFIVMYGLILLDNSSEFVGFGILGLFFCAPLMMKFVRSQRFAWWRGVLLAPAVFASVWVVLNGAGLPSDDAIVVAGLCAVATHMGWSTNAVRRVHQLHQTFSVRNLKKNNVFGSGRMLTNVLEESLNMVWNLPGMKSIRVDSLVVEQVFVFGHTVFLVRPVHVPRPGVLRLGDKGAVESVRPEGPVEVLTDYSFSQEVVELSEKIHGLGKDVTVYVLAVGYPSQNVLDVTIGGVVNVVRGEDLDELLMSLVSSRTSDNFVDRVFMESVVSIVEQRVL